MSIFKPRANNGNFLFSVVLTTAKMLFIVLLILGVSGTGVLMGIAKAWVETAPALDISTFDEQAKTSFIYDKNGRKITDFKGTENRIDASWSEIPDDLKNAVIAVEDQRFLTHNGVDVKRILGAFVSNLLNNGMQGGSTITQQLIKQTMLTSDQNYKRKLQEAYLALQLEKQLSKDEILLEYLNVIYLGGSNYGVKVAAKDYFGKEVADLTLRECACLARIIRNPYRYNPRSNYYTRGNPTDTIDGTNHVLKLMYQQGLISQERYEAALADDLQIMEKSQYVSKMYDNAYYVEYAIYDVVTKMLRAEKLEDTSANRSQMEGKLRTGGYQIYTCLDPEVQQAVQKTITEWDDYPATRNASDRTYKAPLGNGEYMQIVQPQAAAAVTNWRTGELVAVVGGRAEPIQRKQFNRAYQSDMPVGSSLKPLSVYGPALDLGNSPASPVINAPIRIEGWDTERGYPSNFGNAAFTGVESMRTAITKSNNTSAAQLLFGYVGIDNAVNYLLKMGVNRKHIAATGAGLALGASGVSMIEMAGGFGMIANQGQYLEPYAFTKVLRGDGSVYLDINTAQVRRQVFKPSTAWMLVDMLKGCVSEGGTGTKARFGGFTVAGKTGTNSDYRGVCFAGMTGYYAGAVWVGCDNYKPLVSNASGGTYAAPLWAAIMKKVHNTMGITEDRPIIEGSAEDFGLVKATVCAVSGLLPTRACRNDVNDYGVNTDYFLAGTEPTEYCNMHRTIKLCSVSLKAPSEYCRSVRSYGAIYLPEGHPLRYGDIKTVRQYFIGASTDATEAEIGYCTACTGRKRTTDSAAAVEAARKTAQGYIDKAQALIASGRLTAKQNQKMYDLIDDVNAAIGENSASRIKKTGKTLQQYIKKVR